jgi:hypothetical protein
VVYSSSELCSDTGAGCLWPLTHMTGGPLLVGDFVGESGVKGLLERRRSSGELGVHVLADD